MWLSQTFSCYTEAFLRLLYPACCAACDRLLELEEKGLCMPCLGRLQQFKFRPSEERIRVSLAYGDEGWALFRYEDLVKEILHKIKFERRRDLLQVFSKEITDFLSRRPELAQYDLVVPVPLDPARRIEREFNQAGLLARKLSQRLQPRTKLDLRALSKKHSTPAQHLKGREARRINLTQAFHVRWGAKICGKKVLLIDDIFTTGATLEEGAKTLKRAGAKQVGFFVLARTPSH